MDDIAIYFEKVDLPLDMCILRPVNVVKGKYIAKDKFFLTEYGDYLSSIDDSYEVFNSSYFGHQTTLEKLKKSFGDKEYVELLNDYFYSCAEYYYLGYYDDKSSKLITRYVPLSYIENYDLMSKKKKEFGTHSDENHIKNDKNDDNKSKKNNKNSKSKMAAKKEDEVNIDKNKLNISLGELRSEVSKKIIGQLDAVNDVTREIYVNQTSLNPRNKSHILIAGPTGTGKTEIVSTVCDIINLPFFIADATAYTKEGYVGKSPYSMIDSLVEAAGGDVAKAQNGILVIDEVDKKLTTSDDKVSGIDVIYSLNKMMERGIIETDKYLFDTSNLTIIFMGAFQDLFESKLKERNRKMGFANSETISQKLNVNLTREDLAKSGMPREFIGRIGDLTHTNPYTVEDLKNIIQKSSISPLLIQKQYFKDAFNIDMICTDEYITEIANIAHKLGTNARSLKPIIKESLKYAIDYVSDRKDVKKLILTKETAHDNKKYTINKKS